MVNDHDVYVYVYKRERLGSGYASKLYSRSDDHDDYPLSPDASVWLARGFPRLCCSDLRVGRRDCSSGMMMMMMIMATTTHSPHDSSRTVVGWAWVAVKESIGGSIPLI